MKPIKIKLSISPTNIQAVAALHALLLVIGANETVGAEVPMKVIKAIKPTPEKPVSAVPPSGSAPEEILPTATLEQIREVLGQKVTEHREAIKAQLTKFDAKNVSVLAVKHYDEFKAFLDKL